MCELYLGDCHSCLAGNVSLFKPFANLYKVALQTVFKDEFLWKKWARKDFSHMQLRWRNTLIAWRAETREKRTKRDMLEEIWEWKRTKREKCTRLPQQNWLSTLHSFFALLDVKMKIMDPQVYDVSSPALKGVWRKMTTLWVSLMTNNLNWREKVYDLVAWISTCI